MVTPILNHIAQALARLRQQYKGKPRTEALIRAFNADAQPLEDLFQSLASERTLENSEGLQLDNMGDIIGIDRLSGESDEDYRFRLRAKIAQNVSQGEPEAIIALASLLLGAEKVVAGEGQSRSVTLFADVILADQDQINFLWRQLEFSLIAGVRLDSFGGFVPDDSFSFDGEDDGQGFSDDSVPDSGGQFATEYLNSNFEFGFDGDDPKVGGFGHDADPLVGGVFVDA
jgi:hypothetical protein